ncbi:hypothetical protein QBC34DRAFT_377386 [Podospora aff. communis PSN243]|uniref:Uncharacterized protein n=1 Tax=Podospora aff. communis PSN243 TaxID=3040156 RepID=A0AAV9GUP5_9PEZI|nr:hypothetical protein QBC34DRAFT_377386 [Podospora aff. communis PSN243]
MPAISHALVARDNFASREPGVMVVFCIVGVVGLGLLGLFISRKISARRAAKQTL